MASPGKRPPTPSGHEASAKRSRGDASFAEDGEIKSSAHAAEMEVAPPSAAPIEAGPIEAAPTQAVPLVAAPPVGAPSVEEARANSPLAARNGSGGETNRAGVPDPPQQQTLTPAGTAASAEVHFPAIANGSSRNGLPSSGTPATAHSDIHPGWPGYAKELSKEWHEKPWGSQICRGAETLDREQADAQIALRQRRRQAAIAQRERLRADALLAGVPQPTVPVAGCSSLRNYDLSDTLGEGTFGVVVRGRHRLTGQAVALKKLTVHDAKDGLALTSIREIKFLKYLRHPSIVPIVDMVYAPRLVSHNGVQAAKDDTGEIYMVEPYMDHDLAGLLSAVHFTVPQIKLYIKQFLEGVAFLHANNIVHRDIKSANLLISNSGQLQIADFGLARALHNPAFLGQDKVEYTGTVVTRWYRPPELLAGNRFYGPEIDLWGVGCILAEMFVRRPLFTGESEVHQLQLIAQLCGSPDNHSIPGWSSFPGVRNADATGRIEDADMPGGMLDFGYHPRTLKQWLTIHGPVQIPPQAADLIDGLLQLNPASRTPASQAIDHDWLWTAPLPADPGSLPQYSSKKELDRKRQDSHPVPLGQMVPQAPPKAAMPMNVVRGRSSLPINPNLPAKPMAAPVTYNGPRRSGPGGFY